MPSLSQESLKLFDQLTSQLEQFSVPKLAENLTIETASKLVVVLSMVATFRKDRRRETKTETDFGDKFETDVYGILLERLKGQFQGPLLVNFEFSHLKNLDVDVGRISGNLFARHVRKHKLFGLVGLAALEASQRLENCPSVTEMTKFNDKNKVLPKYGDGKTQTQTQETETAVSQKLLENEADDPLLLEETDLVDLCSSELVESMRQKKRDGYGNSFVSETSKNETVKSETVKNKEKDLREIVHLDSTKTSVLTKSELGQLVSYERAVAGAIKKVSLLPDGFVKSRQKITVKQAWRDLQHQTDDSPEIENLWRDIELKVGVEVGGMRLSLADYDRKVAVEVGLPSDFIKETDRDLIEWNSWRAWRQNILESLGWCVIKIPYYEWQENMDSVHQRSYLRRKLVESLYQRDKETGETGDTEKKPTVERGGFFESLKVGKKWFNN
eukprot:Platyproteum_vivax@DN5970_c0_g2_i1.p1